MYASILDAVWLALQAPWSTAPTAASSAGTTPRCGHPATSSTVSCRMSSAPQRGAMHKVVAIQQQHVCTRGMPTRTLSTLKVHFRIGCGSTAAQVDGAVRGS